MAGLKKETEAEAPVPEWPFESGTGVSPVPRTSALENLLHLVLVRVQYVRNAADFGRLLGQSGDVIAGDVGQAGPTVAGHDLAQTLAEPLKIVADAQLNLGRKMPFGISPIPIIVKAEIVNIVYAYTFPILLK